MSKSIFKHFKCDLTIRDTANIYFTSMKITDIWAKCFSLVIRIHLYCTLHLGYHKQSEFCRTGQISLHRAPQKHSYHVSDNL